MFCLVFMSCHDRRRCNGGLVNKMITYVFECGFVQPYRWIGFEEHYVHDGHFDCGTGRDGMGWNR